MLHLQFGRNEKGRDFAVGDIHGYFHLLEEILKQLGFNEEVDRLFSVGDLVDRGPQSHRVLDFLSLPWFYSVRGNHEQFAIDYHYGQMNKNLYADIGGQWFMDLRKDTRQAIVKKFEQLPIAIDLQIHNGLVGIVHADCYSNDWNQFTLDLQCSPQSKQIAEFAMNERRRVKEQKCWNVDGLYKMIVGHTPQKEILSFANVMCIDTGAHTKKGHLSVIELTSL
jgi:serine/threonine protein phosphatase 1